MKCDKCIKRDVCIDVIQGLVENDNECNRFDYGYVKGVIDGRKDLKESVRNTLLQALKDYE